MTYVMPFAVSEVSVVCSGGAAATPNLDFVYLLSVDIFVFGYLPFSLPSPASYATERERVGLYLIPER